jgi:serine/threonine protein kinase
MGTVFRALWTRRGIQVAVKLLPVAKLTANEYSAAAAGLEREATALRLAMEGGANKWVVPLFGVARGPATPEWIAHLGAELVLYCSRADDINGTDPELLGLVMAWQTGGTLHDLLHGSGRTVWLAKHTAVRLQLLEGIAEGVMMLHSAHPHMVVHGDLTSSNVLLTAEGEPRLSDFGLAEIKAAATTDAGRSSGRRLEGGEAGGTWKYMAPEMYPSDDHAQPASRTTDIYALVTLCWETLTASLPQILHKGKPVENELHRVWVLRMGGNLDWNMLPSDIPQALRKLLSRGVSLRREDRPTARDLLRGLRDAREELEGSLFDVFLSHAWLNDEHAPVTTFVHSELIKARYKVWLDVHEMGQNMTADMIKGIARSTVYVALISRSFARSKNCMFELRQAKRLRKPIVAVNVDHDEKWWPSSKASSASEREMAGIVSPRGNNLMIADLRKAVATANWGAKAAEPPHTQKALLDAEKAVPKLLRLVGELHEAAGRSQTSGGSDACALT